jgi:predicted dehydrogenase
MLQVLMVGCGNIAGGFDAERPGDALPLTHAGAYRRHGGFHMAACVEPDARRRAAFMQRWGVAHGAAQIAGLPAALLAEGSFDVVSLCSPTACHAADLDAVLALRPRLVFCEKPIAPTLAQSQAMVAKCRAQGVAMAVNHTRAWAPDVAQLAAELAAGTWGPVRSVVGTYNKGVLNNGSHLLDLLHRLLGPLQVCSVGSAVADFWPDDPTIPAVLRTSSGVPVHLATAHAADYAVFEMQIVTARGTLTMEDGGQRWRVRRVVPSPQFAGYRVLNAGECRPGRYAEATLAAVANLHDNLQHGAALHSDGRSALAAHLLCDQIRRASRSAVTPPSQLVFEDALS